MCGDVPDVTTASGLAWVTDRDADGRVSWMCPHCARTHLRAIESTLSDEYF
jgi:hypothetical protein